MESFALPLFRAGHRPVLGEWLALPLVALAGSMRIGDEALTEIFHPMAVRLLDKCDGPLRVGGGFGWGGRNGADGAQPWTGDLREAVGDFRG